MKGSRMRDVGGVLCWSWVDREGRGEKKSPEKMKMVVVGFLYFAGVLQKH